MWKWLCVCQLFGLAAAATVPASADVTEVFSGNPDALTSVGGEITGTGVYLPQTSGGVWGENDSSPVSYPGYGYVPSPGIPGQGEKFDLEGLFYEYSSLTGELNVWVVTSIDPLNGAPFDGVDYYLGDLFLDVDGSGWDYALLSFADEPTVYDGRSSTVDPTWDPTGRDAGDVVALGHGEELFGINGPASYASSSGISNQVNPWAVSGPNGAYQTDGTLTFEEVDESVLGISLDDDEDGPAPYATYVLNWSVAIASGLSGDWDWHLTVQCGNDLIEQAHIVPLPGSWLLGAIGACLGALIVRRRV
jgi:hypothetical protein